MGVSCLLLSTGMFCHGAVKERKEDIISLAERQALIWQDSPVAPICSEVSMVVPGDPQVAMSPSHPQPSVSPPERYWPSIWYPAAILALVGMLISSIVASRIRVERDAARQANRLKSDFLANVSHEIRTPMNAILGFSQILKAQLHDERHEQYINAITTSGNTLLRLINDLLDLAKIEAGKFELQPTAVALKSIALEIQTIFMQVVEEKALEFVVDLHPALPEAIYLDEVRLRQILFNLLKNAVKFTDKGRISLTMRPYMPPSGGLMDLEIIVADTGVGIPLEEQAGIFEAFTQRKSQDHAKYAGTGLGLSITKRLVEIIGGEIALVSEVGKGSTFTTILRRIPVAPAGTEVAMARKNGDQAIRFDQEAVVLVIDAIDSNRLLIREFLRSTKLAVVETISVNDGIDWCMAIKPDLILVDYKMSYLRDAAQVDRFNRVKEELNIPVVAITSSSAVGSNGFQTDFHFDGWLKEPLLLADVMEMLARFLPHSTLYRQVESGAFADLRVGYALPEAQQVRQAVRKLEHRVPSLMRILIENMMEQWKENRETFIINEIKTFAQEIHRLSMEFQLEFLGLWATEVLSQIRTFDMERLPYTFNLFPELVAMIESYSQVDEVAGV
jgi:polar amino acid transport system substrate-binding protein/two-component system sensor histidine kinase EvgS